MDTLKLTHREMIEKIEKTEENMVQVLPSSDMFSKIGCKLEYYNTKDWKGQTRLEIYRLLSYFDINQDIKGIEVIFFDDEPVGYYKNFTSHSSNVLVFFDKLKAASVREFVMSFSTSGIPYFDCVFTDIETVVGDTYGYGLTSANQIIPTLHKKCLYRGDFEVSKGTYDIVGKDTDNNTLTIDCNGNSIEVAVEDVRFQWGK